jgi:hypothetical protein
VSRPALASEGVLLKGLPSEVRAVIQEDLDYCPDARAERGFVTRRDVNSDGVPDYILDYGKLHPHRLAGVDAVAGERPEVWPADSASPDRDRKFNPHG